MLFKNKVIGLESPNHSRILLKTEVIWPDRSDKYGKLHETVCGLGLGYIWFTVQFTIFTYTIMQLVYPPTPDFSWKLQKSQGKSKTTVMRNFGGWRGGGDYKVHLLWSIWKKKKRSGNDNENHLRVALKCALRPRTWFPTLPLIKKLNLILMYSPVE